jgi:DNA polymerase (family 10)
MDNYELAQIFRQIAMLLQIKGEDRFKTAAYERAAETIQGTSGDLCKLDEKELLALPGIGKAIAKKIQELCQTGSLEFLQKLEAEIPVSLVELLAVPDVGPKKAALFWKELDITSVDELEAAAKAGKIRNLPGMGEKTEARILAGIETYKALNK